MRNKKKLRDKILLILTGLIVAIALLGGLFFIRDVMSITEKWTDFIFACIAYLVLLLWGALTFKEFKRVPKHKLLLFWSVFYVLTISIAYFAFRSELLPMPKSFHVYTAGIVILLIIGTLVLLELFVKKFKFFRDDQKIKNKIKSG